MDLIHCLFIDVFIKIRNNYNNNLLCLNLQPSNDSLAERTEIWHGEQEINDNGLKELASVKIRYDSIVDHNEPPIMVTNEVVIKACANIRNRGCRIRLITEISANNILYCKKLDKLLDLRHFDGIKGNLGIVDGIRYGSSAKSEEKNSLRNISIAM